MKHKFLKEILDINFNNKNIADVRRFMELFTEYNLHTNLMSKNDIPFLFEKHVFDSLAFNLFYRKYKLKNNLNLMDIGSGGGFPSLLIAMFYKNINVFAVDSVNKKVNFLRKIKEDLLLKNFIPKNLRIEDIAEDKKNSFDIVTARAFSSLNVALEYAIPYLVKGGYFVAYKSIAVEDEIEHAQNALKVLGAEIIEKIEYKLPLAEDFYRLLLIIRKKGQTPDVYPRNPAIIKKNPL